MRLFSRVSAFVFALFFLAACGEEGEAPVTATSDPTPAQVSQALSDPAFIEATEMLASEGLAVDVAAAHVSTASGGNWALELPVVRLYTGGVVPYEAVVYEVVAGVGDVYFVEAEDGIPDPEATDEVESVANPSLDDAPSHKSTCGPWSEWYRIGWICKLSWDCNRALFAIQERRRTCHNGVRWVIQLDGPRHVRKFPGQCGC